MLEGILWIIGSFVSFLGALIVFRLIVAALIDDRIGPGL